MVTPAVIYWVDQAAEITISGEVCTCRMVSGETVIEVRAKVPTLLESISNGTRAFAGCLGQCDADVVSIGKARGH